MSGQDHLKQARLLTIPREIRDQIWELLFIKSFKEDPEPFGRAWPHMKGCIYATNRRFYKKHLECLKSDKKNAELHVYVEYYAQIPEDEILFTRRLSYPRLTLIQLHLQPYGYSPSEPMKRLLDYLRVMKKKNPWNYTRIHVHIKWVHIKWVHPEFEGPDPHEPESRYLVTMEPSDSTNSEAKIRYELLSKWSKRSSAFYELLGPALQALSHPYAPDDKSSFLVIHLF